MNHVETRRIAVLSSALFFVLGVLLGSQWPRAEVHVPVASQAAPAPGPANEPRPESIESPQPAARRNPVAPVAPDASAALASRMDEIVALLGPDWVTRDREANLAASTGVGELFGGLPSGEWTVTWPKRNWTETGPYALGARHGKWQLYNERGELIRESRYFGGKLSSMLRERDNANAPWRTYDYRDGELQSE